MTHYAQFDPEAAGPRPIIGWYDGGLTYPNLPPAEALIEVGEEQWAAHFASPSGWAVQDGALIEYTPPPPPLTLQQQAALLLRQPVMVQCTSLPALNGNYPLDQMTQMQITSVASAINAGLGLPGGGATFNWPDVDGEARPWPAVQFTAYAQAMLNFVYAATQVARGFSEDLPSTTIEIA